MAPTDKSMPPAIMTIVAPTAMMAMKLVTKLSVHARPTPEAPLPQVKPL